MNTTKLTITACIGAILTVLFVVTSVTLFVLAEGDASMYAAAAGFTVIVGGFLALMSALVYREIR